MQEGVRRVRKGLRLCLYLKGLKEVVRFACVREVYTVR